MHNFTFLTIEEVYYEKLRILKEYGIKCAITDFAILLGGAVIWEEEISGKDRCGWWWTKTPYRPYDFYGSMVCLVRNLDWNKDRFNRNVKELYVGARPAIAYSSISSLCTNNKYIAGGLLMEIEYGEYPQMVVLEEFSKTLESAYLNGTINQTGKKYTTNSISDKYSNIPFVERSHIEYEYDGKKYIRFIADDTMSNFGYLSDGRFVRNGDVCWIEVEPIKWLIDIVGTDIALSKKILFSGIGFHHSNYYSDSDFSKTDIKKFMDTYFSKDIIPSVCETKKVQEEKKQIEVDKTIERISLFMPKANFKDKKVKIKQKKPIRKFK